MFFNIERRRRILTTSQHYIATKAVWYHISSPVPLQKKCHSWQHWLNKIWHCLSVYMLYLSDEITISDKEVIFLLGGFESSTIQGSLRKLELPTDICHLFQNDPHQCKTTLGCAFCSHFDGLKPNKTYCYSNTRTKPAACSSEFQSGMYLDSFSSIDVKLWI